MTSPETLDRASLNGPRSDHGGPRPPADPAPLGLATLLERAAAIHPGHGVGYLDDTGAVRWQSYPALLDAAQRVAGGLRALGLGAGDPVLFQLEDNAAFITAFWGCVMAGVVPVPVSIAATYEEPHSTLAKLANAWSLLDRPWVLSDRTLAPRLKGFAAREGLAGLRLAELSALAEASPITTRHAAAPETVALMLLTSGSTGTPKLVCQTHGNLAAWTASVAEACEFTSADISLNWMPLDHVGGLVMFHLRDVGTGCRQLHAATETVLRRPLAWLDWIDAQRATITWAPNFAYGLVNEQAEGAPPGRWDLSCMRFVLNGGEAVVPRTARRFLSLLQPQGLPATAMRPAWGMSETCSGVTYSRRFSLATTSDEDGFTAVGEPIGGIALRIADTEDRPLPEGRTGRLQIRGISVTTGYHLNPAASAEAFTADGWFITGDLGVIADGQLTIVGREKDAIIVNGANFHSHEIEAVAEEVDGVARSFTAACAVRGPGDEAERLAIFFSPTEAARPRLAEVERALRATVSQRAGVTPDYVLALQPEEVPKTAIGKIQRALLRQRFEAGEIRPGPGAGPAPTLLTLAWRPEPLPAPPSFPADSVALVLLDHGGLGRACVDALRASGLPCYAVAQGALRLDGFEAAAPLDRPEGIAALFALLGDRGVTVSHVVLATACDGASVATDVEAVLAAQAGGGLALLRLLKAWTRRGTAARLVVPTRGLLDAAAPGFAQAPLRGLLNTLPHEEERLTAAVLHLGAGDTASAAAAVVEELARAGGPTEIAWRDGERLVPMLAALPEAPAAPGLRRGGIYLITGANGGIGRLIAQHLRTEWQARLILLSRSALTAAADPDVLHAIGDVADAAAVDAAVARGLARWGGGLDGVLHLAVSYAEALLAEQDEAAFLEVLRVKLGGAVVLHGLAQRHPGCTVLHFSSLLSLFGAMANGAYAAANAGLEAFAGWQRAQGVDARAVQWSLWRDAGIGRTANAAALAQRGLLALPATGNLALLEQAMRAEAAQILVGLDHDSRALQPWLDPSLRRQAAGAARVAPRTPAERALATQWMRLLKLPEVGVEDNFFDLGGRSLLAAQLFAWVEREYDRALPLATLYAAPTIAALARLLEAPAMAALTSIAPAHAIQPLGGLPPIFCIPGVGSDVMAFDDLARALGTARPLYGIQLDSLDGSAPPQRRETIETAASDILQEIRRVQPVGPYRILGHCFGALLAWEVARQARQAGQEVALLALLDPVATNMFPTAIIERERVRYAILKMLRQPLATQLRMLLDRLRGLRRVVLARQRLARAIGLARQMHGDYRIGPYDGDILVFMAEDSHFKLDAERDPRRYLERFAGGGVDYLTVPGNHDSMLHPPCIAALAERLQARL